MFPFYRFKKELINFSLLLFAISFSVRSTAQLPDLRLENLTNLSDTEDIGAIVEFNFDLINSGTATAEGDYTIAMYLSDDNSFGDEDDIKVGEIITGNTAVGTIPNVLGAITVPDSIDLGDYILYINVDDGNVVTETNEDNNLLIGNIQITSPSYENGCSFLTRDTANQIDFSNNALEINLSESDTGYNIMHWLIETTAQETTTIGTYELTKEGEVTARYEDPFTKDYEVIFEKDAENNIEMVFLKSPDLAAGTRVPIDINYDGTPTTVFAFKAFKTSMGFAFSVSLMDPDDPDHFFYDRIFQTNNVGEIQLITEIPVEVGQPFNFTRLVEGADGGLYLWWFSSGNYSLFGIPANGASAWHASVAVDTPSATWVDTKVSVDGQFVYTAKTDNQHAFITKYNALDGTPLGINISEIAVTNDPSGFWFTYVKGIQPTEDGGLLVSIEISDPTSAPYPPAILAKYDASDLLLWKRELNNAYTFRPIGGTSDGGAFFIGVDGKGTFADKEDDDVLFLKLTATGALLPICIPIPIVIDSIDLALGSLELLTTPTTVGQEIRLGFEIVNLGEAMHTAENISAKLFLSTDQNFSDEDIFIVENSFGLGNVIIEGTTPNDIPEGTYYALIVLDDNNSIVESDETNNVISTATNFTIGMVNSISELAIENFKIYPTITNNKITMLLSSKISSELVLKIYNISGQEVHQKQIKVTSGINQFQLNASEFASGMYHVILLPENGQALTRKFIKQ